MNFKTINENGYVVVYYPNTSKWLRFKEDDFSKLINNLDKTEIEEYYGIIQKKSNKYDGYFNTVYISMTNLCNLNCEFCASKKIEKKININKKNELTIIDLEEYVIPLLKKFKFNKIIITGGEPFCNKNILNICRILSDNFGRDCLILETNGLLIDSFLASEISKWVYRVEISIENVICDIALINHIQSISNIMNNLNVELSYSYVITKNNVNNLRKALDYCDTNNAYLNYRFVQPFDESMGELILTNIEIKYIYKVFFDYLLDKKNAGKINYGINLIVSNIVPKSRCNAFGRTIALLPDGRISMCVNLQDEKYLLGVIDDYNNIGANLENIITERISKINTTIQSECSSCKYIDFCSGLCLGSRGNSISYDYIDCKLRTVIIKYNLFFRKEKNTLEENTRLFLALLNEYF